MAQAPQVEISRKKKASPSKSPGTKEGSKKSPLYTKGIPAEAVKDRKKLKDF